MHGGFSVIRLSLTAENGDGGFGDGGFGDGTTAPEPATLVLMATGLVGVGAMARRRRK